MIPTQLIDTLSGVPDVRMSQVRDREMSFTKGWDKIDFTPRGDSKRKGCQKFVTDTKERKGGEHTTRTTEPPTGGLSSDEIG